LAAGVVRRRAVTLDVGVSAAARTAQTRLIVAGEVGVRRTRHARHAHGVGASSARLRRPDTGPTRRARATDAPSTAATARPPVDVVVVARVMSVEVEPWRTVALHRRTVLLLLLLLLLLYACRRRTVLYTHVGNLLLQSPRSCTFHSCIFSRLIGSIPRGRGAECCDEWVGMRVCLSVRSSCGSVAIRYVRHGASWMTLCLPVMGPVTTLRYRGSIAVMSRTS